MGTTADKLEYLQGTKAAIKEAIVSKGVAMPDGTTFRAYAEKIGSIVKVPSLSNPGSASDLRNGKQLVGADGGIITGTLAEVIQATPTISVSSGGLITASATQSGGIVEGGSKSATQQLTTQAAKTVTPGTTAQTAVAAGRYVTGDVDVAGDANLVPENIAEGVSIFGVQGTHSGGTFDGATVTFIDNVSFGGGLLVYALNPQLEVVRLDNPGTLTIAVGTIAAVSFGKFAALYETGDVEILFGTEGAGAVYVNGDGTITAQD